MRWDMYIYVLNAPDAEDIVNRAHALVDASHEYIDDDQWRAASAEFRQLRRDWNNVGYMYAAPSSFYPSNERHPLWDEFSEAQRLFSMQLRDFKRRRFYATFRVMLSRLVEASRPH